MCNWAKIMQLRIYSMYCDVERVRVATTMRRELLWLLLFWYCYCCGGVLQLTVSNARVRYVRTYMGEQHKCWNIQPERWFIHKVFVRHKTGRPSSVLCLKKTFSAEGSASSTIVMVYCLFRLRVVHLLSVGHWFSAHRLVPVFVCFKQLHWLYMHTSRESTMILCIHMYIHYFNTLMFTLIVSVCLSVWNDHPHRSATLLQHVSPLYHTQHVCIYNITWEWILHYDEYNWEGLTSCIHMWQ